MQVRLMKLCRKRIKLYLYSLTQLKSLLGVYHKIDKHTFNVQNLDQKNYCAIRQYFSLLTSLYLHPHTFPPPLPYFSLSSTSACVLYTCCHK